MCKLLPLPCPWPWLLSFFFFFFLRSSTADVGTASHYAPPYLPTVCYGNDASQFPENNLFAAAGDGVWDNGASCGRQYLVRCLSSAQQGACIAAQSVQVKVVEQGAMLSSMPSKNGTTLILSTAAFRMIANQSAPMINIEYMQV